MYKAPITPTAKYREDIEKLNEKISEEKKKENADFHRIMKLEEQKLMQQLFSNDINGAYSRFSSPW